VPDLLLRMRPIDEGPARGQPRRSPPNSSQEPTAPHEWSAWAYTLIVVAFGPARQGLNKQPLAAHANGLAARVRGIPANAEAKCCRNWRHNAYCRTSKEAEGARRCVLGHWYETSSVDDLARGV
jgi:hypothetical protein